MGIERPPAPTKEDLRAARGRSVPDVIAPELRVLFCGINPGLYSGAVGHHFARPGNRFWKTLHLAGFTDRVLAPWEERELLALGLGITNLVDRATATASEIDGKDLREGADRLRRKAARFRPRFVAVLGVGAARAAFGAAGPGEHPGALGRSRLWVLPNPSGLNAHYQLPQLADLFAELRRATLDGRPSPG